MRPAVWRVILAVVFYIMASRTLGFVLTGFIILTRPVRAAARARPRLVVARHRGGGVIAIQQFFGDFLRVPLPWGVLQPIAW
jgi:putative tricarboxylic transport membrane protein